MYNYCGIGDFFGLTSFFYVPQYSYTAFWGS